MAMGTTCGRAISGPGTGAGLCGRTGSGPAAATGPTAARSPAPRTVPADSGGPAGPTPHGGPAGFEPEGHRADRRRPATRLPGSGRVGSPAGPGGAELRTADPARADRRPAFSDSGGPRPPRAATGRACQARAGSPGTVAGRPAGGRRLGRTATPGRQAVDRDPSAASRTVRRGRPADGPPRTGGGRTDKGDRVSAAQRAADQVAHAGAVPVRASTGRPGRIPSAPDVDHPGSGP